MQRGSAQILSLLIGVVVILAGAYFYFNKSNNPQDSVSPLSNIVSNVNIYTNNNLGFEFEYPKTLTAQDDSEEEINKRGNGDYRKNFKGYIFYEPGKFLGASVVLGKESNYEESPFTVWVFDNPDNLSIDSWDKKYWYYPFVWGDFTSRRESVAPVNDATVSGQLAKYGIVTYQPGKPKFVYLSNNNNKMYLFRIIGEEGDKILGTFKFL